MCGRANGHISREPPRDGAPLPGGIYASPTNTRGRVHEPKTLPWGERPRRGLRPQARFGAQPGRKARLLARRSRPRPTNRGKQPANREPPREAGGHGRHVCRPYNARHTPYKPGDGRRGGVLRAAYMPPLRIDQTRSQPKSVVVGRVAAGVNARPTEQGERGRNPKTLLRGGRARAAYMRPLPYKGNNRQSVNGSPRRSTPPQTQILSGRRPRSSIIFHF